MRLLVTDQAGAEIGRAELTASDAGTSETSEFFLKAPIEAGDYAWLVVCPAVVKDDVSYAGSVRAGFVHGHTPRDARRRVGCAAGHRCRRAIQDEGRDQVLQRVPAGELALRDSRSRGRGGDDGGGVRQYLARSPRPCVSPRWSSRRRRTRAFSRGASGFRHRTSASRTPRGWFLWASEPSALPNAW